MDPDTQIHINVPQPNSTDAVEQAARATFEQFPPGFQRALESSSLERVNEVLGKMSVSEAEEIVERLGDSGMLSLERGVIDGTTEEGRERLKDLEREARGEDDGERTGDDELDEGASRPADQINDLLGDMNITEANPVHESLRESKPHDGGQNPAQASGGVEPVERKAHLGTHPLTNRPQIEDLIDATDPD